MRNSGKTVLLTQLDSELQTTVGKRFNAAIDTPGGTSGLSRDLGEHHNLMLTKGKLPGQTDSTDGKKTPAVYSWRYTRKGRMGRERSVHTVFSFYDNAGEDFATSDRALSQRYLGATSGAILLLDPFGFPGNRQLAEDRKAKVPDTGPEDALEALTTVLRAGVKGNKKVKQPIAVVISKIDAFFDQIPPNHPLRQPSSEEPVFDESESLTVHDHVGAMVEQWGGGALIRGLQQNYETFRLFGVSALGAEPDYATASVSGQGLLPHRVAEPLLWLMAIRGFIPSKGG